MTDKGWAEVVLELSYSFKGELDEVGQRVYRRHLDRYTDGQVLGAVAYLLQQKQTWLPTVGELLGAIDQSSRQTVPTFDEAWAQVLPALSDSRKAVERLQRMGAAEEVVAWVQSYGGERMGQEPVADPEHGGAVLHRLRQSYVDFLERAAQRRAKGLPLIDEGVANARGLEKPDYGQLGGPLRALEGGKE